ncbi:ABC transporter substrate-binding protein [Thermofilum sp.]|jgi:peptide/nickel transport system substrate-binding protein|uniref:ABC transporter substrate-binding protein n=1 Tax=Thermofilum sp. TaxID=1961369 RepID=UPI00258FFBF3|nr:ABC transporter substrate-binding protein [Thermofilum sp.]
MNKGKISLVIAILLIAILVAVPVFAQPPNIPREQTLITGGAWWEPPKKFNPLNYGGSVSGTNGLIYEPLYLWIPIKPENERFQPWLAAALPNWISPTEVEIKIRPEAKWWDGSPVTADDVRFTFYDVPRKVTSAAWAGVRNYITDVVVVDSKTVRFKFDPQNVNYGDFLFQLYSTPILPKKYYEPYVNQYGDELTDLGKWPVIAENKDPTKLLGSGMYKVLYTGDDYFILERVDNWWGKDVFGKLPGPKYIKGVIVYSNQVAANMLGAGELDWSTFYIPGGPTMVQKGYVVSFYSKSPYYLSANVAFLFLNTAKKPFNDPNFRKALYYAIDINKIINSAYEGAVVGSNPVGLLPYWQQYLATDLLNQYGYKYDPQKAKQILDQAGYKDVNGDGWRETPDGKPLKVTIIVPYGWTDWMFAAISIADDLKAVGINAEAVFPDFGAYVEQIDKGTYDAAINNFGSFAAPTPYQLYYWAYNATPGIWTGNMGRYQNAKLQQLITQLGKIPPDQTDKMKSVLRDIQQVLLDEMPALPLWLNGYWFLASQKYWTGWPNENNPYAVPTNWNGQWQHGGLLVLLNLKPATQPAQQQPQPTTQPTAPAGPDYTTIGIVIVVLVIIVIAVYMFLRKKPKKEEAGKQ